MILAVRAVSAVQHPDEDRGISTDSARLVRDECRFPSGPRLISSVVRTHAKSHRERASGAGSADYSAARIPEVHFGADLPVVTGRPACRRSGHPPVRAAARGPAAPGPDTRGMRESPGWPLSCRHGGVTAPAPTDLSLCLLRACSRVFGPVPRGCESRPDWPRPVGSTGLDLYSGCRRFLQRTLLRCRHVQRCLQVTMPAG